jgi:hypothetical protein
MGRGYHQDRHLEEEAISWLRGVSYSILTSRAQNSGEKELINAAPAKQRTTPTPDELPAYPARAAWRIYVRCNSERNELFLAFGDRLYLGYGIGKHPKLRRSSILDHQSRPLCAYAPYVEELLN